MGPGPNFGSKWKEVLGFGDSLSRSKKTRSMTFSQAKPNLYQITTEADETKDIVNTTISSYKSLSYPKIPRDIFFFHLKNEILISACPSPTKSSPDEPSSPCSFTPRTLFYITLSTDVLNKSDRPDIILHANADKASTAICFSKIHFSTPVTDMTLCPPPKKSISANFSTDDISKLLSKPSRIISHDVKAKHVKTKSICTTTTFNSTYTSASRSSIDYHVPRFRTERLIQIFDSDSSSYKYLFFYGHEAFEWKMTQPATQHMSQLQQNLVTEAGYDSGGMRLVRALTGEVLVVYARIANTSCSSSSRSSQISKETSATAMLRFRNCECMNMLAEDFDILVIVSLVSIVEKERIERRYSCPDLG